MAMRNRDPRTKEELLDRMLSFDFDGDIRHLGARPASVVRTAPNRIELTFPDSGRTYELQVRIPREEMDEPEDRRGRQTGERGNESRSFARQPEEDLTTVQPEPPEPPERRPQPRRGGRHAGA